MHIFITCREPTRQTPFFVEGRILKIFILLMLASVVLSGCNLTHKPPPTLPAQQFVATLINYQIPKLQAAYAELAQASTTHPWTNNSTNGKFISSNNHLNIVQKSSLAPTLTMRRRADLKAIRFLGKYPETVGLATSSKATSLRQAITSLVPIGWEIKFSHEIMPDEHKSWCWVGNDQWPYVLDKLLQQYDFVALLDWSSRRISLAAKSDGFEPGSAVNIPQFTESTTAPADKASPVATGRNPFGRQSRVPTLPPMEKDAIVSEPRQEIQTQTWRIEAGTTLKDALFNWAAGEKCATSGVANWTIVWSTSVNYRIDAPLQFNGNFRDALNSLFTLYGTAKVPLYAGIRNGQCVISVDEKELH